MKGNKKLYSSLFFLAILFLALLLLLLGSFWDLPIAKGMFQKIGDAGPFLSPIVSLPGYILFALSGAMLVSSFSLSNKPIIQKILIKSPIFLTPIISGLLYGYFSLTNFLSLPLALLVGLFVMGLLQALWLWVENKNGKRNLVKEAIAIISSFAIVVLLVWILNEEIIRYSYKAIISQNNNESLFANWWALEGKDPEVLKEIAISPSLRKGGPSLDSALSAFALFLPFILPEGVKEKTWISYLVIAFFVFLGVFIELSVGQYFLSAIAWGLGIGGTISGLILFFIEYPSLGIQEKGCAKKEKRRFPIDTKEAASRTLRLRKENALRLRRKRKRSRNRKKNIIILKSLDEESDALSTKRSLR